MTKMIEPVTDQEARAAVEFSVAAAEQNWEDEKPLARLTVIRRIAQDGNTDERWNKARNAIVQILDAAEIP